MSRIKTKFITDNAVTNAKLAQIATATFKARATAGTGNVEDLSVASVKTLLNLAGTNSGDVTLTAVGATPNASAASLSTQALTLQPADGTNPGVLTAGTQTIGGAKTFNGAISASNLSGTNTGDQTITLTGGVTGSGTGSFAATVVTNANLTGPVTSVGNATSVTNNAITNAMLAQVATATFKGRTTASTGNVEDLTATQATALLNTFTSSLQGLVPASGGGTTNFLRADGTFAAPGGASTPTIFGSRGTPRSVVAATGITTGASHMSSSAVSQDIYVEGSITGDSVAATISAGTIDGQRMTIIGRTDTKTVTLNSTTTNVALNGPITMGAGDVINLRWDTTNWHEVSRA